MTSGAPEPVVYGGRPIMEILPDTTSGFAAATTAASMRSTFRMGTAPGSSPSIHSASRRERHGAPFAARAPISRNAASRSTTVIASSSGQISSAAHAAVPGPPPRSKSVFGRQSPTRSGIARSAPADRNVVQHGSPFLVKFFKIVRDFVPIGGRQRDRRLQRHGQSVEARSDCPPESIAPKAGEPKG